jgi:hypothetical protein
MSKAHTGKVQMDSSKEDVLHVVVWKGTKGSYGLSTQNMQSVRASSVRFMCLNSNMEGEIAILTSCSIMQKHISELWYFGNPATRESNYVQHMYLTLFDIHMYECTKIIKHLEI